MSGCTCEPGVELRQPHAPWLCRFNPDPEWETRWCPDCGWSSLDAACPEHGHLADVPDEENAA